MLKFKQNRHYPTLKSLFFSLKLPRQKTVKIKFTHEATLPIPLPTYFGGNKKTPSEIIIECK